MANFVFNSLNTGLGSVTVYVGGTTSTTTLDANLISISELTYDFTKLETFELGNCNLSFNDVNGDIRTNLSSIINQSWIIDVDGTKYFEGKPLVSSATFTDNIDDSSNEFGVFSVVIGANLLDTSGSYSGLTSYDTNYYSLSDVIEQTIKNNTSITSFSYLSAFTYTANGETVYLDSGSAGANDAFIVIEKTAINDKTSITQVLNYLGAKLCIWKNTCYIWQRNYTGDTQTVAVADVVNTISYLPYQKLDDYYVTSTIKLRNGAFKYNYVTSLVRSESFDIKRGTDYSDDASRILDGSDFLYIWDNHSLGNWVTDYTLNYIVVDEIFVPAIIDLYASALYWTKFVIFYPTDTTTLTLSDADFYNSISAGDKLMISFDCVVYPTDTAFNASANEFNMLFTVGAGEQKSINLKNGLDPEVANSNTPVNRVEIEYDVTDSGDIELAFTTTAENFTSAESTGVTIAYDGANTILSKTLISNDLSADDYVLIENSTQPAFDGVYKVTSLPTANTAQLDRTPYTSDTTSYDCTYRFEPIFIAICNLNIGKISDQDRQIEIFDYEKEDLLTPIPYSYEKNASAVENDEFNAELRYDIISDTALINAGIYSINSPTERLNLMVDNSTINPYSSITFSPYSITDGYIQKFTFNFNNGIRSLAVIK